MRTLKPEQKRHWPKYLPELVFLYNATPHSSTGMSPFNLLYGVDAGVPVDLFLGCTRPATRTTSEHLQQHIDRLAELHEHARERLHHEAHKRERCPHHTKPLKVGDLVLLRLHQPGWNKIGDYYGPTVFKVVSLPPHTGGFFTIERQDGRSGTRRVSGSQIRPYIPDDQSITAPPSDPPTMTVNQPQPQANVPEQSRGRPPSYRHIEK